VVLKEHPNSSKELKKMCRKRVFAFVLLSLFIFHPHKAHAFIMINEIFADPAAGLSGDPNNDGVRSATQDEFVELFNYADSSTDISGWFLSDATQVRHIFLAGTTLLPYEYIVVFSGGDPNVSNVKWQKASTGSLNLNNTAETVSLFNQDSQLIDQVIYGSLGDHDQSIVRTPEGSGVFVLHSTVNSNGTLFSPGSPTNGQPLSPTIVPESPNLFVLTAGLMWLLYLKRRGLFL
jgi:hypothetical protein